MGLISSALEHAVPEQMFVNDENPGEAISAVKALQKANAQGQRIYHLTPANQAMTLPAIHQNSLVMQEIRAALNAGKEVITHTDPVSVPGWSGAGYILFDPETGDGAFKIGGGQNGGIISIDELIGIFAGIFVGLGIISGTAIIGGASLLYFFPLVISYIYFWALLSLVNNYAEFATGAGVGLGLPYFTWQVFLSKAAIADAIALIFGILSMVL